MTSVPCSPRNWVCGTAIRYPSTRIHRSRPPSATSNFLGAEKILAEGRRAVAAGDYRWATEILHKLVFADPDNTDARELQADAYEQMGYQSEGPQWRGIFLTAAKELREGPLPAPFTTASRDTILGMPIDILFDFVSVQIDGTKAADADIRIELSFTDTDQRWTMWVARGVLNARRGPAANARVTATGPKIALTGLLLKPASARQIAESGAVEIDGDAAEFDSLAAVPDTADPSFPIVTP